MNKQDRDKEWEKAFRVGFYAGFAATGEGWNGEYPFQDDGIDIKTDKGVNKELDIALKKSILGG